MPTLPPIADMETLVLPDSLRLLPADWPGAGPIDLARHDLPHRSSTLEWWYLNGHLQDALGRSHSFFASFFQIAVGRDAATGERLYAHALTWALIDADGGRYHSESLVDRDAAVLALARLDRGFGPREPRLRRALREMLESGRVPAPDTPMRRKAAVDWHRMSLDFDGRTLEKLPDGRYRLRLQHPTEAVGCDLVVALAKPVVRHGDNGVVAGTSAEDMFYYFCPRCTVEGTVTLDGAPAAVVEGAAWYDHEFGAGSDDDAGIRYVAWNWLSTQLDNGCELTVYDLYEGDESRGHHAVVIDAQGERHTYDHFELLGEEVWTSTRTFADYPLRWTLRIPEAGIELRAEAAFAAQEFITFISKSAFWEGRVRVEGTMEGRAVRGNGFVERANFGSYDTLEEFFGVVSRETRRSVSRILPAEPTETDVRRLVWGERNAEWSDGVGVEQYRTALIEPVREISDRGGKSWRSYAALVCCDAVGGDSTRYADWMALPELLHVGSLIVDDVQDNSAIRRGGEACHVRHGVGPAINAGSLCYFLPHLFFESPALTDRQRLTLYDLYFRVLRAAHAGQGLDLAGLHGEVERALHAEAPGLEARVLAIHRLKSAAPASALAQIGGVLGGGNPAQIHALGHFMRSVGEAFQIIDDVLNLRGFDGDTKLRGEDLAEGKVTMPVAKALDLLPLPARADFWRAVAARPQDPAEIARLIRVIDGCGALEASERMAHQLVEDAWRLLDPVLPDSYFKLNLRAFGWYTLERHY